MGTGYRLQAVGLLAAAVLALTATIGLLAWGAPDLSMVFALSAAGCWCAWLDRNPAGERSGAPAGGAGRSPARQDDPPAASRTLPRGRPQGSCESAPPNRYPTQGSVTR